MRSPSSAAPPPAPPPAARAALAAAAAPAAPGPAAAAATAPARRLWPAAALFLAVAALPAAVAAPAPTAPAAHGAHDAALAADLVGGDYPDYASGGRFEEYPVVVPKRTALLLDRIMTELQHAIGEGGGAGGAGGAGGVGAGGGIGAGAGDAPPPRVAPDTMDLQRRGQQKGSRIYWRCYFNAVTCFRRK